PDHSGMGELSPARGKPSHLCQCRPCHFRSPVAMGEKEAPQQAQAMDERTLLSVLQREELAVLRTAGNQRRRRRKSAPAPGICPYQATCENQRRGKPLRSRLGRVL